jgi:hypothetical protein
MRAQHLEEFESLLLVFHLFFYQVYKVQKNCATYFQ